MLTTPLAWEEHNATYNYHGFIAYGLVNLFEYGEFKVDSIREDNIPFCYNFSAHHFLFITLSFPSQFYYKKCDPGRYSIYNHYYMFST
jgi:hypothetical protein